MMYRNFVVFVFMGHPVYILHISESCLGHPMTHHVTLFAVIWHVTLFSISLSGFLPIELVASFAWLVKNLYNGVVGAVSMTLQRSSYDFVVASY